MRTSIACATVVVGYSGVAILASFQVAPLAGAGIVIVCSALLLWVLSFPERAYVLVAGCIVLAAVFALPHFIDQKSNQEQEVAGGSPSSTPKFAALDLRPELGYGRDSCGLVHTVAKNETLNSIAKDWNVSVLHLQVTNAIQNPDAIREGSELYIPCGAIGSDSPVTNESPDDQDELSRLTGRFVSCLVTNTAPNPPTPNDCLSADVVSGESASASDTLGSVVNGIQQQVDDLECVQGHVLGVDASINQGISHVSGVLQFDLGNSGTGRSVLLIFGLQLAKVVSRWLITDWNLHDIRAIDPLVGADQPIVCP